MNQEEQNILYARMHEEWLQQPMTKLVLSAIDGHTDKHIKRLNVDAQNPIITDSCVRFTVVSMQNTIAIKTLITDTTTLIKNLTKQKEQ